MVIMVLSINLDAVVYFLELPNCHPDQFLRDGRTSPSPPRALLAAVLLCN